MSIDIDFVPSCTYVHVCMWLHANIVYKIEVLIFNVVALKKKKKDLANVCIEIVFIVYNKTKLFTN